MPLRSYGDLSGRVVATRREGAASDTPHYQIQVGDETGTDYRVAVNVESRQAPSELLYLVVDDFRHPLTTDLARLASGWTPLPPAPGGAGLDYIRANLFDPSAMRSLPPDVTGPDNDLADLLEHYVTGSIGRSRGRRVRVRRTLGAGGDAADKVFGFRPGNGVHDVHMNQGNSAEFRRDDGVWQDGGLVLHFPASPAGSRSSWRSRARPGTPTT